MKKNADKTVAEVEAPAKRKYTKRSPKWNLKKDAVEKKQKQLNESASPKKKIRKESVMKVSKDKKSKKNAEKLVKKPSKREIKAAKKQLALEKKMIKDLSKLCKQHAKKLAKLDDISRAKEAAKLIKLGYAFAPESADNDFITVGVHLATSILPKMKKLKPGAKAVEKKEETAEVTAVTEVPEPTLIKKAVSIPEPEDEEQPKEILAGDTYTDDTDPLLDVEGTEQDEDEFADDDEDVDEEDPEEADKYAYRKEFYGSLEAEGDDSNM